MRESYYRSIEKCRQQRSRPLAVLTYSFIRSARPRGCGLAGRAFLNTPVFFYMTLGYPPADPNAKYFNYSNVILAQLDRKFWPLHFLPFFVGGFGPEREAGVGPCHSTLASLSLCDHWYAIFPLKARSRCLPSRWAKCSVVVSMSAPSGRVRIDMIRSRGLLRAARLSSL